MKVPIISIFILSLLPSIEIISQTPHDRYFDFLPWKVSQGGIHQPNIPVSQTAVDVDMFTGNPIVNLPLYQLECKKIKVPISLNYNLMSVKPNIHPGVTGLGWNLICGGEIKRQVRGTHDDRGSNIFNPRPVTSSDQGLKIIGGNENNWSDESFLYQKICGDIMQGAAYYNIGADVFSFNVLGYSGTFRFNNQMEWEVISDTPFKIEHTIETYKVGTRPPMNSLGTNNGLSATTFTKFTLTAPDGTVFIFGGKNAIEYTAPYFREQSPHLIPFTQKINPLGDGDIPVAQTWMLSKIISTDGKEINFEYTPKEPIVDVAIRFFAFNELAPETSMAGYGQAVLTHPTYLTSISIDNEKLVSFEYQNSKELDYDRFCIPFKDEAYSFSDDLDLYGETPGKYIAIKSYDLIKRKQLVKINIKNSFNYTLDYTSSDTERLKLLRVNRYFDKKKEILYEFGYNPHKFPRYNSGHNDHLGFYNGKNFEFVLKNDFITDEINPVWGYTLLKDMVKTYKEYTYSYLPVYEAEIFYNKNGNIANNKKYAYNKHNMIKTVEETINGDLYTMETRYSGDLMFEYEENIGETASIANSSPIKVYDIMRERNILSHPIEKTVSKNGMIVSANVSTYKYVGNKVVSDIYYELKTKTPLPDYSSFKISTPYDILKDERLCMCSKHLSFDSYGNTTEIDNQEEKIIYLWSYKGKYPVAKILNATYQDVVNNLGISIDLLSKAMSPDPYMDKITALRDKLPQSHIEIYEYKPYIGITKITDGRNYTIHYIYDDAGRLTESFIIQNGKKETLNIYEYNYKH